MKAVLKTNPEPGIEIRDIETPQIAEDEVLVKVKAAGICGSDVHIYEWTPGYEFLSDYLPKVLGHEFSGEVVEVGRKAEVDVEIGDRVTSETGRTCGRCFFCVRGENILCPQRKSLGRLGLEKDGAMAEFVAVPSYTLHKIPDNLSYEEAAVTEPAGVALHAVELAEVKIGDNIAIFGPGPIGLIVLQVAQLAGADKTVVFGLSADERRLDAAKKLGADLTICVDRENPREIVNQMTEGIGVDIAFEVSGAPGAFNQALQITRAGGQIVVVGIYADFLTMDVTHQLVRQQKSIKGSYGAPSHVWKKVLRLMANKRLNVKPLIKSVPIEKAEEGFGACINKEFMKVLIVP